MATPCLIFAGRPPHNLQLQAIPPSALATIGDLCIRGRTVN